MNTSKVPDDQAALESEILDALNDFRDAGRASWQTKTCPFEQTPMIPRDRRAIGQTRTLTEHGVDMERILRQRLQKVQTEMTSRDIGALLPTEIVNIRYATGIAVMPNMDRHQPSTLCACASPGHPGLL